MFSTTDLLVGVDIHRGTNVVQVMDGRVRSCCLDSESPTIAPARPVWSTDWCRQPEPIALTTIPGIAPVFAAGVIAEIGDFSRFEYNHAKVASFASLKWSKHQSTDFTADEPRLKRTSSRLLHYYLCEAAQLVRLHDAEYVAFYQKKYNEVRHHRHKRAITLTARKLVRLVVRLLTTNEPFRARQVPGEISA